jgi:hypothetical protein
MTNKTVNWMDVEKTLKQNIPKLERTCDGKGCPKANANNRNLLMVEYYKMHKAAAALAEQLEEVDNAIRLKELAKGGGNECPICLEPISKGLVVLKCGHQFCALCFAQHSRTDNKCLAIGILNISDPMPHEDIVITEMEQLQGVGGISN